MAQDFAAGGTIVRGRVGATIGASAAINTSETVVAGGSTSLQLLAGQLLAGNSIRVVLQGTCTSTAANTSTFRVKFGTNGTTADGTILSATTAAAQTSGTNIAFTVIIEATVRTVGASATIAGTFTLINQGTTGISTTATQVIAMTASAFDSTVASYISVSYVSAASTTTSTFQNGIVELF